MILVEQLPLERRVSYGFRCSRESERDVESARSWRLPRLFVPSFVEHRSRCRCRLSLNLVNEVTLFKLSSRAFRNAVAREKLLNNLSLFILHVRFAAMANRRRECHVRAVITERRGRGKHGSGAGGAVFDFQTFGYF